MALNVADISHDHDARCVIDGWPLDATDRTSDPRFTDVVTLGHRNNVGIYGPTPALQSPPSAARSHRLHG